MKAIVYVAPDTVELRDIPKPDLGVWQQKLPRSVGAGMALLRVSHAGICGSDLNIFAGTHPRAKAPLVVGHEFSGVVEEILPGAVQCGSVQDGSTHGGATIKVGDSVTVNPLVSCGSCGPCMTGNAHVCDSLKLLGIDFDGGMAEYAAVPIDMLIKLPSGVSGKLGALIEPVAVSVHAVREHGFLPGDNALVFGAGPIGLCVALTLRKFGARSVSVAEVDRERAGAARSMGFEVVDPSAADMVKFSQDKTSGAGFDWVYDCAGAQPVADILLDVVKARGKIVIVAGYKYPCTMPFLKGMFKELSIGFVRVYRQKDVEIAASMVTQDTNYEKIITHVLTPEDAKKGFDLATKKGSGAIKIMYNFE